MGKPQRAYEVFEAFRSQLSYRDAEEQLRPNLSLGNNVLRLRVERGMSQSELAKAAGMRQPRIADIEGAKGNPALDTIARIAAALDVSIAALFENGDGANIGGGAVLSVSLGVDMPTSRHFQDDLINGLYMQADMPQQAVYSIGEIA